MIRFLKQAFMASIVVLLLIGCGAANIAQTFDNSSFFTKSKAKSNIQKAIQVGASNKGWSIRKIKNGLIEASILVRSRHYVAVNIEYNSKGYVITYKKSRDMNYNPKTKAIHRNYNKWVKLLQNSINFQLDNLDMGNAV